MLGVRSEYARSAIGDADKNALAAWVGEPSNLSFAQPKSIGCPNRKKTLRSRKSEVHHLKEGLFRSRTEFVTAEEKRFKMPRIIKHIQSRLMRAALLCIYAFTIIRGWFYAWWPPTCRKKKPRLEMWSRVFSKPRVKRCMALRPIQNRTAAPGTLALSIRKRMERNTLLFDLATKRTDAASDSHTLPIGRQRRHYLIAWHHDVGERCSASKLYRT